MGRIGFPVNSESVNLIEEISKLPNIHMEGLFTHFAKADEKEKSYTLKQHERFFVDEGTVGKTECRYYVL